MKYLLALKKNVLTTIFTGLKDDPDGIKIFIKS